MAAPTLEEEAPPHLVVLATHTTGVSIKAAAAATRSGRRLNERRRLGGRHRLGRLHLDLLARLRAALAQ